jgi:glutathionylspermidine synthase
MEGAAKVLLEMLVEAGDYIIEENLFAQLGIPGWAVPRIKETWESEPPMVYGRFDFSYGPGGFKLLEYNADTPTSLLEASVIQWHWMQECFPAADQFNSLHERLIEAWQTNRDRFRDTLYFSSVRGHVEDYMTVNYLRDTAMQAGLATEYIAVEDIGWNDRRGLFLDLQERPIREAFKLYPWEWLLREQFGPHLTRRTTRWLEPPWKMILSNKAILAILWELFPQSPYLLPASFQPLPGPYVRKPTLSREGANVTIVDASGNAAQETDGPYVGPYVYQQWTALPQFDGNFPVIGSWMINGYPCGLGVREDVEPITQNSSRFVPHLFE